MDEMFSMLPLSQYALSQMGRSRYRCVFAACRWHESAAMSGQQRPLCVAASLARHAPSRQDCAHAVAKTLSSVTLLLGWVPEQWCVKGTALCSCRGLVSISSQTGNDRHTISCQSEAIPCRTASTQAPGDDTYQPSSSTVASSDSRKALSTQPSRQSLLTGGSTPSSRRLGRSPSTSSSAGSAGGGGVLKPGWERRMAAFLQASVPAVACMLAENAAAARPVFAQGPASSQEGE